jgi:release factor glutamine methyltransferase
MNPIVAAARRFAYRVWYRRARAALERSDACSLFGLDLVIHRSVLHPAYFPSSRVLGAHVLTLDLQGKRVADLGTGSGVQALLAARAGARVTAIDVNRIAADCAAENARRNGLGDRVTTLVSDLFDAVPQTLRFDLVITNPPFYSRAARSPDDQAFAAGAGNKFFESLAESLPERLHARGALVMIQSSDADFEPIERMFAEKRFRGAVVREERSLFETLTVREFRAA